MMNMHAALLCSTDRYCDVFAQLKGKAIIAQNKGGGHGELGYHLALKLIEKDISVTLLQDGAGKNQDKQPFARCASCVALLTCLCAWSW